MDHKLRAVEVEELRRVLLHEDLRDELAVGEHEGHARQARLAENRHHDFGHASKVLRDVGKRRELRDEEDHEDDKELAAHQKLLELDGSVDEGVALEGARILDEQLGVPLLASDADVVQGLDIGQEREAEKHWSCACVCW